MKILVEVNQAFTNKCFFLSLVNNRIHISNLLLVHYRAIIITNSKHEYLIAFYIFK